MFPSKLIAAAVIAAWCSFPLSADETELVKVVSPDPSPSTNYGSAVAMDRDRAVVGEPFTDAGGRACVYRREAAGWVLEATLQPGVPGESFGYSVALHDDVAVIGAPGHDAGAYAAGAAYLFRRHGTTWTQESVLVASDAFEYGFFGGCVALAEDVALIGSTNNVTPGYSGTAYVFRRTGDTWSEEARIVEPEVEEGFSLGLAIEGDTAVVGAPLDTNARGSSAGSVFLYHRAGDRWSLQGTLEGSEPSEEFGSPLALRGGTLVVGVPFRAGGEVHVFHESPSGEWVEEATLTASDAGAQDYFGLAVAGDGVRIAVGAPNHDEYGSAYLFERNANGWREVRRYHSFRLLRYAWLGAGVALWRDDLLAGAPNDDDTIVGQGAAYFFCHAWSGVPWIDHGHATAGTNGEPLLTGEGDLIAGQPLRLDLANARSGSPVLLVVGTTNIDQSIAGISLLPRPDFLVGIFQTDANGALALPALWPAGVPTGSIFYSQMVIADPASPRGYAASNALSATTR